MKKLISRVCCLCCVVLVLAACLPFSAFAVDPVSAGVMANAFAQAIAAYGASNGVAMTFDVTSTDGIGETMHELWSDFRAGTQDADDYATLAAALFPELYYKASSVVAGASDVYTVGYNISSTYAEEFDNFFDWLLSGPAEMVKVDNQYYQFSQAQIGTESVPIVLLRLSTFSDQPVPVATTAADVVSLGLSFGKSAFNSNYFWYAAGASNQYAFCYPYSNSNYVNIVFCSTANVAQVFSSASSSSSSGSSPSYYSKTMNSWDNTLSLRYGVSAQSSVNALNPPLPYYTSLNEGLSAVRSFLDGDAPSDSVGVKASTNTGVAQFPDTTDPNYEAVGKQIPSTVPWDNTAYGDGTGALTDAQAGAIAAGADTVIARDGVLDLAGTDEVTDEPGVDDPPTTDPDDYAVPGLAEIFPFCIPFDIYNFLSALAANPVAPHFTATLDFPEAVGGTQTIDIDFDSPTWNQLAQLLRLLELLAFIIGLALLTRSMFIRG